LSDFFRPVRTAFDSGGDSPDESHTTSSTGHSGKAEEKAGFPAGGMERLHCGIVDRHTHVLKAECSRYFLQVDLDLPDEGVTFLIALRFSIM
jgi:hypothetical protein